MEIYPANLLLAGARASPQSPISSTLETKTSWARMTIYTSQYPSIDLSSSKSIYTFLLSSDRYSPSLPAFTDALTGQTISRAELRSLTLSLAYGLRNVLPADVRLRRGDTALIYSPNSLAWPVVVLGIIAAGSRATLANSAYTPAELAYQYEDSRAQVVFCHPSLVGAALEMFKLRGVSEAEARKRIVLAELSSDKARKGGLLGLEDLISKGALEVEEKFEGEQVHETTLLCYSSGTTGKPKGVETTHKNLTSVISIVEPGFAKLVPGKDILLSVLPYYHIYGMTKVLLYPLFIGVPVVIMPKFDPTEFCRNIATYRITASLVVPPILLALVQHPATTRFNITSLNFLSCGAAPLGASLLSAAINRLKSVGATVDIAQGYGLTETSPVTHIVPRKDVLRKVGSIGLLLPNLEARIVETEREDGEADLDAKEGEPGELWIRGPSVMKGYLNNPSATRNAITPSGWFKTGDVAVIDKDGFYAIVDRKKELIKYKGFQVPPAELESVLLQHPQVADAAVIGIEDVSQATELPRAYIVHKEDLLSPAQTAAFAREIQKWMEGQVARHMFLRGDAIPKSAAGKILRRQLRDRAKEEVAKEKAGAVKAKL
ncbi:hypothetical protein EW146_g7421 [Bondarzewia mesenterica]|uniref:AMP-dependent synthetase/ligase domain-containing protein n=1 Tax=Bondarzewia mesenterica TaxID=1095465 RepID=A0A4S4LKT4_9AGAM|nr:hypothetical protein EW146_g7421 [Bondarzewia mesenterica]